MTLPYSFFCLFPLFSASRNEEPIMEKSRQMGVNGPFVKTVPKKKGRYRSLWSDCIASGLLVMPTAKLYEDGLTELAKNKKLANHQVFVFTLLATRIICADFSFALFLFETFLVSLHPANEKWMKTTQKNETSKEAGNFSVFGLVNWQTCAPVALSFSLSLSSRIRISFFFLICYANISLEVQFRAKFSLASLWMMIKHPRMKCFHRIHPNLSGSTQSV